MDTNRIKNVALGARTQLMAATETALDRVLATDSRERVACPADVSGIEDAISSRGRDAVVEQVAYTWFNRLCALRYMDMRGYTPVGIVSPRDGETLPAILADARRGIYAPGLEISEESQREVSDVIDGTTAVPDPLGHAYVRLLLTACSMYARSMEYLFGASRDLEAAIELLAPTDLLSEGSLLHRICDGLDEAICNEGVEVMGWLYQFYVSERKDAFFASKKKATAADIAPATQLFTPNWIVRYLVENSLGRLWMLNFPDSALKDHMDYYVEPEEPEDDFLQIYSPEDITFLDPACGSGHILVYAFDLLYLMYEEEGYRPGDIPELILKNNLTGIEIDDRAAEIASFCLEMKALEKDADFFNKDTDANIVVAHAFNPREYERKLIAQLCVRTKLMDTLSHFSEVGSLFQPDNDDLQAINDAYAAVNQISSIEAVRLRKKLKELEHIVSALVNRYSISVTNPPYMTSVNMNPWLKSWINQRYPDEKGDFCTCFIERSFEFSSPGGFSALVTMQSWMFISIYERMREKTINSRGIVTMAHLGTHAFDAIGGEVVSTTAAVFSGKPSNSNGVYIRLVDYVGGPEKASRLRKALKARNCNWLYVTDDSNFNKIPGKPIAYWASNAIIRAFTEGKLLYSYSISDGQNKTTNNEKYLRLFWELPQNQIGEKKHYRFYAKGGSYRKWYGNLWFVVNWSEEARRFYRKNISARIIPEYLWYREGITWSLISTDANSFRYLPESATFDVGGSSIFIREGFELEYALGLLNSSLFVQISRILNPTINCQVKDVRNMPVLLGDENTVCETVSQNKAICKEDWDAFETSWNFTWHPLVPSHHEWVDQQTYNMNAVGRQSAVERIEMRYRRWERDCHSRFDQLKANEEELNRIFARIYGMEGEVPIEVPDDKVSVRLADLGRDIRSLISYGVGCMFGRYSLDEPGLILADEGSTLDDYHAKVPKPTFEPDSTGIIPITSFNDALFEDDIVAQFRRWLAVAYGEDTLGENIAFIENALGKGLRAYFARDFYNDHVKTYQKRPIYWMFSSPKRGLQALVYLHRYNPQTVSALLADYVRPLRDILGAQARLLEVSGKAKDASLAAKYDATVAELDAWEHDVIFPLAQKHVALDLDDGVKANYGKPEFKGALRKIAGLN